MRSILRRLAYRQSRGQHAKLDAPDQRRVLDIAYYYYTTTSTSYYLLLLLLLSTISSPGLRRGHVKKNAFHVKGVGEIVNQTVKSDRAIAPLLKTNNSTEGRQVEIS